MKIWRQHELGDPVELLQLEEVDPPVAGTGQVVVDVEAVGLTFVDCLMARGLYQMETKLPWSPCTEVVGRVRELGDGVEHLAVGDRVVGIGGGSLAEQHRAAGRWGPQAWRKAVSARSGGCGAW